MLSTAKRADFGLHSRLTGVSRLPKSVKRKERNKRKQRRSRNWILELRVAFLPNSATWKALKHFASCLENH
jgi:hypothetical protein